jgi:predicted transcriptional regulator YdeE
MIANYVTLEAFTVVGMEVVTTTADGKNLTDCPGIWEKFCGQLEKLKETNYLSESKKSKNSYGLCFCVENDDTHFRYIAGISYQKGDTVPEGMTLYNVPATKYAVFTHEGDLSKLSQTFSNIYQDWYKTASVQRNGDYDFELYNEDFKPGNPNSKIYIYTPVK